jgi:WD40 repeat protein
MTLFDRTLVQPGRKELEQALKAAAAAANGKARTRVLRWPPRDWADFFRKKLGRKAEGWQGWIAKGGGGGVRSVVTLSWWSDHLGRKHHRIVGDRPSTSAARRAEGRPALACIYPDRVFYRTTPEGRRHLNVLCGCGVFGTPEQAAWMGDRCGPCHDRREAEDTPLADWMDSWILTGHSGPVYGLAFSPDGLLLASGSGDGTVRLWETATGGEYGEYGPVGSYVMSVAFSPDGEEVAAAADLGEVWRWECASGRKLKPIKAGGASGLQYAPGGSAIATCVNGDPTLWDARTGKRVAHFTPGDAFDLVFVRGGRGLVSGTGQEAVQLWDVASQELRATLEPQWDMVHALAAVPGGTRVVLGTEKGGRHLLLFWDLTTFEVTSMPTGHTGPLMAIAFSPDGGAMLTGSGDGTVKSWDARTGEERVTVEGHDNPVFPVAFSPDGRLVASGSYDGVVRLWPAEVFR